MRDERGRPCHKTCAEALTDDEDQGDVLAVVIEMPIAPVIDLATRRRIA